MFYFSKCSEKMVSKIALEYDLSCIISKDDISFFSKIWPHSLDGKRKMIFLKKIRGNMMLFSNILKILSFQKNCNGVWSFSNIWIDGIFSPENMIYFFFRQKMKDDLNQKIHENMINDDIHLRKYSISIEIPYWFTF